MAILRGFCYEKLMWVRLITIFCLAKLGLGWPAVKPFTFIKKDNPQVSIVKFLLYNEIQLCFQ